MSWWTSNFLLQIDEPKLVSNFEQKKEDEIKRLQSFQVHFVWIYFAYPLVIACTNIPPLRSLVSAGGKIWLLNYIGKLFKLYVL